ncbi:MAG TPA: DHHA1 domain-containing protein [candidate division Zixibacteria bacterium]|nr:hypothetical protein [candidate division Zixibacteria bacterium]MDD4918703.1 DHHA1 domain-containing protein [candidate division Zixibacteria bacterium]MDM7973952.1 DHHA1 domain-containing protein [candidate division Zixibacteria bacterium]HOD65793.1 DHHA1 domain-containing protein [candidate division Zixibacteria bacterium]HOZ06891.1 DHHA1 domain-containing protein [candidate division Zixibacteria bacterium]
MTERLYYTDPDLLRFEARILDAGREGGRYFAVLDRTAFYPTSGGQLFDTGILNSVSIVDVTESSDGTIRHYSPQAIGEVGAVVSGAVDAARRKRHRRQHTAQHILSHAFLQLHGCETVSVHLGEEYGAIEFDTGALSDDQLLAVEERAEEIIFADLPVDILFVPPEQIATIPLRRPPKKEGILRVIRIGDIEYSACGGTHCRRTGQVGLVKIIGVDKMRGHALVNFLAGDQARDDYAARLEVTARLTRHFTCNVRDLGDKVLKLEAEKRGLHQEVVRLQRELLPSQADSLAGQATAVGERLVLVAELPHYDPKLALQLAALLAERINGLAVLLVESRLYIAVGPGSGLHAGNIVKALGAATGLRGGGGPLQAQLGGADPAQLTTYRALAEKLVREA